MGAGQLIALLKYYFAELVKIGLGVGGYSVGGLNHKSVMKKIDKKGEVFLV